MEPGNLATNPSASSRKPSSVIKTKVFAAIDEEHAEQLIGVDINGCIKRVEVEPYEVVNYRTGEIQVFTHKNVFVSPNKSI